MEPKTSFTDDARHAEPLDAGDGFFELARRWRVVRVNRHALVVRRRCVATSVGHHLVLHGASTRAVLRDVLELRAYAHACVMAVSPLAS